ncbi:GNAT family N-acetyltransferase [Phytomonospora sp. NPDC050363]|uniref:GNAT family N-acetyltransferase n=1 Tax=Phytomonospora sp. NPDC050363 TaxID=3155642 RepID=UPI0033E1FC23
METSRLHHADTASVDQAHEVAAAAFAVDRPGVPLLARDAFRALLTGPSHGGINVTVLAREGGRVVGFAFVEMHEEDNRHLADVWAMVEPGRRHQGIGRAMFDSVAEVMREHGRDTLHAEVNVPIDGGGGSLDGRRFCEAAGMEAASASNYLRLDLSTVDESAIERLRREAWSKAAGYSPVQWIDGADGDTPAEVLEGLAALLSRFYGDTPTGTLEVEELAYTPERILADNARNARQNRRTVNTAIRHDAGGEVIAWTKIHFRDSAPQYGMQGITMVAREHRGHRLGTVLKTENLLLAVRTAPSLAVIDTDNAKDNAPMLAVNVAMGFEPFQDAVIYQLKL